MEHFVKCPYCDENWILKDSEAFCKYCEPQIKADLALKELIRNSALLELSDSKYLVNRKTTIDFIIKKLVILKEKADGVR